MERRGSLGDGRALGLVWDRGGMAAETRPGGLGRENEK